MEDQAQWIARFTDSASFVKKTGIERYSLFLDPAQAAIAMQVAKQKGVLAQCFGGHADAERVIIRYCEAQDEAAYPLVCLYSRTDTRFASISHRDVLGAMMALGLTRERFGDIILSDEGVYIFTLEDNAPFVAANLVSAGRVKLSLDILDSLPVLPRPKGRTVKGTVASLRLDALIGEAFSVSRAKAQEMIRAGRVRLNFVETLHCDAPVEEGALLSLKGEGRARLIHVGGLTRKSRVGIEIFRYE